MLEKEKLSQIIMVAFLLIAVQIIAFAEYFDIPGDLEHIVRDCEFEECAKTVIAQVDTSNWQTYRNEEYGFEVKYPGGWYYRKLEVAGNSNEIIVGFDSQPLSYNYSGVISIHVWDTSLDNAIMFAHGGMHEEVPYAKKENTQFNGMNAIKITYADSSTSLWVSNNDITYSFQGSKGIDTREIQEILSTFKFIE